MSKNGIMFLVLGVVVGFVSGFMVANRLNRSEMDSLRIQSQAAKPGNSNSAQPDEETLGSDEIKAKVAQADANPTNLSYQKNLGISLYRYGSMKQDAALIGEAQRLLTRADGIDPKDFDVLVALGNAYFDIGFLKKDLASFTKAREVYQRALTVKPGDADVRTDVGISYFVQEPPDYDKAVSELQAVIAANPKQSRAMQFLIQTYLKQGKVPEAEKTLAKIVDLNPADPAIADLRKMISEAKSGQSK